MPTQVANKVPDSRSITQEPSGLRSDHKQALTASVVMCDFEPFLRGLDNESVDLILTDPPYAISRRTGFQNVGKNGVERFAVNMEFGDWDHHEINLNALAQGAYKSLRKGGTIIVFYDLWKITKLSDALIKAGFVQLRFIEWIKANPVPLNSKVNYLTNAREIAVLAVKGSKSTFNSKYDNGVYNYAIPRGERLHPTQKPLELFRDLVRKHSNPGDLVVDPFVGSGTTAVVAIDNSRSFKGCDNDAIYVEIANQRIEGLLKLPLGDR